MNINTVAAAIGGTLRGQIPSSTLATATETEFKINTDASIAGTGTAPIAVLSIPQIADIKGSGNPHGWDENLALLQGREKFAGALPGFERPFFSAASFDNSRPFLIRLAGVATPASNAGNTFQLVIYSGTSKSGTALATTGALTGTETSVAPFGFVVETQCIWDSTSQQIAGQFWYNVNCATPGYHTWATNSNLATSVTYANLKFCASVTWGNAVGGVCAVNEFSITAL